MSSSWRFSRSIFFSFVVRLLCLASDRCASALERVRLELIVAASRRPHGLAPSLTVTLDRATAAPSRCCEHHESPELQEAAQAGHGGGHRQGAQRHQSVARTTTTLDRRATAAASNRDRAPSAPLTRSLARLLLLCCRAEYKVDPDSDESAEFVQKCEA